MAHQFVTSTAFGKHVAVPLKLLLKRSEFLQT